MAIKLIRPTSEYTDEVFAYKKEMIEAGDPALNGCGSLDKYDTFSSWLAHINSYADRRYIDPDSGYVEGSQWILVDEDKHRILGMVNIRHYLNERLLRESGHIGYSIRPSERKKGYGHLQLSIALAFLSSIGVEKALVICSDDNAASYKTIESCGGVLESKIKVNLRDPLVRRYWIETAPYAKQAVI